MRRSGVLDLECKNYAARRHCRVPRVATMIRRRLTARVIPARHNWLPMATIRKEILIDTTPKRRWEALRDVGRCTRAWCRAS